MSALGFVAIILAIFFFMGIWVGVMAVIALSARREDRHEDGPEDRKTLAPRERPGLGATSGGRAR